MNIVLSDPKTGKAYSIKAENAGAFLNKKTGEEVRLDSVGLTGYAAKIRGGSDKQGFPMKPTLPGVQRRKVFLTRGTGFNSKRKGMRKRKSVRGNMVTGEIVQLNLVMTKEGTKKIEELLGKKSEKEEGKGEQKEEGKKEEKEKTGTEEKKQEGRENAGKGKKENPPEEKKSEIKEKEDDKKSEERGKDAKEEKKEGGEKPAETGKKEEGKK